MPRRTPSCAVNKSSQSTGPLRTTISKKNKWVQSRTRKAAALAGPSLPPHARRLHKLSWIVKNLFTYPSRRVLTATKRAMAAMKVG